MKMLLDTCILSELRKNPLSPCLRGFIANAKEEDLFISVISIGEISKGVGLLPLSKKKTDLMDWAMMLENQYSDRILGLNVDIAHIWGEITAAAQKTGKIIPASDGLIAATALAHGLHVVTRNTADFASTGALLFDPFEEKAEV